LVDGPTEPAPSQWVFPELDPNLESEVVGVGADLEPGTLLAAYRCGMFPMPLDRGDRIAWWSPDPRGIVELADLHVSRSLRRSLRRYEVTVNEDFEAVIDQCRGLPRDGGWISPSIRDAYVLLHRMGWAHSVETWDGDGQLVGGLYMAGAQLLDVQWCTDHLQTLGASAIARGEYLERLAGAIGVSGEPIFTQMSHSTN